MSAPPPRVKPFLSYGFTLFWAGSILVLVDDTLAVWTNGVAMPSPSLAEHLGFKYRIEHFPIDQREYWK